jgi:hypothetical protein
MAPQSDTIKGKPKRTPAQKQPLEEPTTSAEAIGPAGELDGPETAGEEQEGFENERQARRQDNIESFDNPDEAPARANETAKRATDF